MTARERCDITISMDADLQDDIEAIDGFLKKYQEGCEVVYGVRSSRATDTVFKRSTAQGFYKLMRLMGTPVIDNHADFRLMQPSGAGCPLPVRGSEPLPPGDCPHGGL